ncbi:hypothetical protein TNCV_3346191 [Trichonephila clavipes]|nr:hypothetical protein TNCV_3346191 [Trichonephila clavipes]
MYLHRKNSRRVRTFGWLLGKWPAVVHDSSNPLVRVGHSGMELEGREIFFSSLYPWFLLRPPTRLFGPPDLTSTYSVCTWRVFGGIETRPSGLEFDALTIRLPTAHWPTSVNAPSKLRMKLSRLSCNCDIDQRINTSKKVTFC